MNDEQEKRPSELLSLTPTQELAAQSVLSLLKEAGEQRTLVILHGLSGVGKSMVLDHIQDGIGLNNGRVVEGSQIKYEDELGTYNGHLVTTATVGEFHYDDNTEQGAAKRFPGIKVVTYILPGMDEVEMTAYTTNLPGIQEATLTKEQTVKYSMGVPLLAQQLTHPGLTEDMAIRIAAKYLKNSFRGVYEDEIPSMANSYLRMSIPDEVIDSIREFGRNHIYDDLHRALQVQAELKNKSITEESPLFVAPESEQIYDAMMQSDGEARIEIFVPRLSQQDLERIWQAFGYQKWGRHRYEESIGTRTKMFGLSYRKVYFWHRDAVGEEVAEDYPMNYIEGLVKGYRKALRKGELGMPKIKGKPVSFFIHSHENNGMAEAPARVGWMTETLLQQRGIPYFVNNETYGKSYIYDPETKHIQFFPGLVEIDRWG